MRCHDSERLDFFGLLKNFNFHDGGYARVAFPEELVLKDKARPNQKADDEGQLLANGSGNTLPVDKTYGHLSGISIQMKAKGKRKAYCCTNVIMHKIPLIPLPSSKLI